MFNPSRDEARKFLIDAWSKFRAGTALSALEQQLVEIIVDHPEYHGVLEHPDETLDRDYRPEAGAVNPFLHLSLHLAVAEQLAIDQPAGIRAHYERLAAARGDRHAALHCLLECLAETVWQAQRTGSAPDAAVYLGCLGRQH